MNQPKRMSGESASSTSPRAASAPGGGGLSTLEAGGEPAMRRAPVPVLLIAFLAALVYWASMYVLEYGGQADARVHYPYMSFKQLQDLQPKGGDELLKAKGAAVFGRVCLVCHQADGGGSTAVNAPPLVGSEWVLANDPSRIIRIVLHGLGGPITVKGKEWGAGQMLAWKETLSDEDIANVLTYVRSSWGNSAPAVKAEDAKKVREETKARGPNQYMTVEELLKVSLKE